MEDQVMIGIDKNVAERTLFGFERVREKNQRNINTIECREIQNEVQQVVVGLRVKKRIDQNSPILMFI